MNKIDPIVVQEQLNQFVNQPVFIHLETTNGAYATHHNRAAYNVGAFIRNAKVCFTQAKISGDPTNYRVGLKTEIGWVYAEGLRDYQLDQPGCLLLAGHDDQGRLLVTLEISHQPFSI
ncbi:YojF family protein [Amphibacillus sediminis]|uniref:YojF family protein n=1 Tax=Amphibacillus sediminis TaxID=360185 RepID=UPI0008372E2E|nr:YojF family protein [Amphibacillus sediminis]